MVLLSHNPVVDRIELSSLCWNMAQILDFKATKKKTIIKTMFSQIPVQIIAKSMQNRNVDLTNFPTSRIVHKALKTLANIFLKLLFFFFIAGKLSFGCH